MLKLTGIADAEKCLEKYPHVIWWNAAEDYDRNCIDFIRNC